MKKSTNILAILTVIAVMSAIFAIPASAADVPYDNLIALYNMNSGLTNVVDGQSGTLKGGASIANDAERGNVLFLDNPGDVAGANQGGWESVGQWAELADAHIPNGDEMTISIWFKARAEMSGAIRIFEAGDSKALNLESGAPDRFIAIHPYRENDQGTQATLNCNDMTGIVDNNRDRAFSNERIFGEWVHVVWVINKGKPNVMYVNGTAYQSTHGSAGDGANDAVFAPSDILSHPEGVRKSLLGRPGEETGGSTSGFDGWLSDVAIFNTALTAEQVASLRAADFSQGIPSAAPAPEAVEEQAAGGGEAAPEQPVVAARPSAPPTGDAGVITLVAVMALAAAGVVVLRKKAVR